MFTGLTRQEQRALILLLGIAVGGLAYHQLQGDAPADALVIDAETGRIIAEPTSAEWVAPAEMTPEAERIDLNTASMTELMTLPGIGETRARSIVIDRERNGPFRSVDEVTRISGIGGCAA
jgi:competence protein ComEA